LAPIASGQCADIAHDFREDAAMENKTPVLTDGEKQAMQDNSVIDHLVRVFPVTARPAAGETVEVSAEAYQHIQNSWRCHSENLSFGSLAALPAVRG
jgi:hypothetical protein